MSVAEAPDLADVLARLDRLTNWEQRPRGEMRVGLEPMRDLAARAGDPQKAFGTVHVAGTKGKGSVCALIEAALLRAGIRAGRYASPHLESVTERVSIGGRPIAEADLAKAMLQAVDHFEAAGRDGTAGAQATWFDLLTLSAFLAFRDAGIEWAVVETGLGGRLDSTNVVESAVAVLTNVELEHTEILGTTREAIAREKAGIIKPGAVVVTSLAGDDEAGRVIAERAAELGCTLVRTGPAPGATIAGQNEALAGTALDALGGRGLVARDGAGSAVGAWLLDEATKQRARLPGRLERLELCAADGRPVPVVLDGAHVPFNLRAVLHDLGRERDLGGPIVAVVALGSDKDARGFLAVLGEAGARLIVTDMPGGRGFAASALGGIAVSLGLDAVVEPDWSQAVKRALAKAAEKGGWALVTGSLHLVGAVRAWKIRGAAAD
ncbi:MAG: bifunctional folylpolyglutamate synthase/dihydrofolate synthase [Sphingomonadales bacterium]